MWLHEHDVVAAFQEAVGEEIVGGSVSSRL